MEHNLCGKAKRYDDKDIFIHLKKLRLLRLLQFLLICFSFQLIYSIKAF